MTNDIFLPGSNKQFEKLKEFVNLKDKQALVIGGGSEEISKLFIKHEALSVIQIVDSEELLLSARLNVSGEKNISVRLMDFTNTDFKSFRFDIIFAQGTISSKHRNKILKEINRLLKPEGIVCIGEMIKTKEEPPSFVEEAWSNSGLFPLSENELKKVYIQKGFLILAEYDLSDTLKYFYTSSLKLLKENINSLSANEKSFHKKILNRFSHESNVYLKLGGSNYTGFMMFILKKEIK